MTAAPRHSPIWHGTARAMRAKHMTVREIADALDKKTDQVRWVLNENGEREKSRIRVRAQRGTVHARGPTIGASACQFEPHVSRQPRRILPADSDIMALCRQFAADEFDRGELSRRLRVSG